MSYWTSNPQNNKNVDLEGHSYAKQVGIEDIKQLTLYTVMFKTVRNMVIKLWS